MRSNSEQRIYWSYRYKLLKFFKIGPLGVDPLLPTIFSRLEGVLEIFQAARRSRFYFCWSPSGVFWGLFSLGGTRKSLPGSHRDCRRAGEALRCHSGPGSRCPRSRCGLVHCHDAASNWLQCLASLGWYFPSIFSALPPRKHPEFKDVALFDRTLYF